jgi:hypothetical protein
LANDRWCCSSTDLAPTRSHKINNMLGKVLLTKRARKARGDRGDRRRFCKSRRGGISCAMAVADSPLKGGLDPMEPGTAL